MRVFGPPVLTWRWEHVLLALVAALTVSNVQAQEPVRPRIAILPDTSSSMLLTPQILAFSETCADWNPCTFVGNPTAPQESCNTCVRDTINFTSTCASNWTTSCRTAYGSCVANVSGQACNATIQAHEGLATRGDGSAQLPGCDLDGDGFAQESRMYQAKKALGQVVGAHTDVEFSLWRFGQVTGGQICTSNAECPKSPGDLSILDCENHDLNAATPSLCAFDADRLDASTDVGFEGQCSRLTHTGAASTFACNKCDFTTSYDRAQCEFFDLARVKTGAVSPLNEISSVQCLPEANPQHRFISYHGALGTGSCDPASGDLLVTFPASNSEDNRPEFSAWIDHQQTDFSADVELRANGRKPLAAALRDIRVATVAALNADMHVPCRRYRVVLIVDGPDTCEPPESAITAVQALQDLDFINGAGNTVSDFDVPVYVIAFAACPSSDPNCEARQSLDAVAAAGGTGAAFSVSSEIELELTLEQIAADAVPVETCNGIDDDCDGMVDEGGVCALNFEDGFESE